MERITRREAEATLPNRGWGLSVEVTGGEDVVLLLDAGDSHGDRELSY